VGDGVGHRAGVRGGGICDGGAGSDTGVGGQGLKGIEKNLARLVEKGTITEATKGEIRTRLKGTTAVEDLKDCGFGD